MSATKRIPKATQPIAMEHYRQLLENKRRAEETLQKCIADLLAFELVLHKPVVLNDWPGRTQMRLRGQLMKLEELSHVPSRD